MNTFHHPCPLESSLTRSSLNKASRTIQCQKLSLETRFYMHLSLRKNTFPAEGTADSRAFFGTSSFSWCAHSYGHTYTHIHIWTPTSCIPTCSVSWWQSFCRHRSGVAVGPIKTLCLWSLDFSVMMKIKWDEILSLNLSLLHRRMSLKKFNRTKIPTLIFN